MININIEEKDGDIKIKIEAEETTTETEMNVAMLMNNLLDMYIDNNKKLDSKEFKDKLSLT